MQQVEAYQHDPKADSFDFRATWLGIQQACRAHKLLIALTCLFTVLFVAAYVVIWPPVYTSTVEIAAESDRDATRDDFYQTWNVFRKERLSDEVHLITTSSVLTEVVQRLKLTDKDVYHSFFSYAAKLWTESWPGRTYASLKKMLLGEKRDPYGPTPQQIELGKTIDNFRDGVKFESLSDANVGKLVVKGPTPRVAQIADTLSAVYLEQRQRRHEEEAKNAYNALAAEKDKAAAELDALEQRMANYDKQNGLVLAFEKDKLDVGQWAALRAAITDNQTAIANELATLAQVNAQLSGESREVVAARVMKNSAAREAMTDRLSQLELSRKQMLIHYRPDAPEVKELDRQIAVVKEQMGQEPGEVVLQSSVVLNDAYQTLRQRKRQLEEDLAGQRAALAVKQQQASQIRALMSQIPDKIKVSHDFDREHSALEKRYVTLQDKMMVASVSLAAASSAPPSVRVVEPASHPDKPSWPKTRLLIAGAVAVGLAAGVLLALLVELIRGRVSRYQLSVAQDRLPIYALVAHDARSAGHLFALPAPAALGPEG